MNRHFSYLPTFSQLTQDCARLRRGVRARGRDVAAFYVPTRTLRTVFEECDEDLHGITMFGVPVYAHDCGGGIIAEKGRRLAAPRYSLDWCEA